MIPKFRIFDRQKKQMVESAWWEFYFEDECLLNVTSDLDVSYYDDELGERWELIQSTGLHDKNGKEIFEGDVVECYTEGLSVVEFAGGVFGLRCNGYFEGFNLVNGQCVIIGNVHEHSHLLDNGGYRE